MKNQTIRQKFMLLCAAVLLCSGCSSSEISTVTASGETEEPSSGEEEETAAEDGQEDSGRTEDAGDDDSGLITPVSLIDVEDQFTERDLDPSYEDSEAITITLSGDHAEADSLTGLVIENASDGAQETVVTITSEGIYLFTGELEDGQIVVDADEDDKVQIVLCGVSIVNDDGACILMKSADKCFLTLAADSENRLADTGEEYVQPDDFEKNVDGVIFADCDLSIGGSGSLEITAGYDNGIVTKKDLKITGGLLTVTSAGKGIEANDSIRIAGGVLLIDAEDDGLHTDNDEESGRGYFYMEDGTVTVASGDDAIHAATALLITGGTITVTESYEGLEGDTIDITGGSIDISSSDDGLNASIGSGSGMGGGMGGSRMGGSSQTDAYIRICSGTVHIDADGDGIDSNGSLYMEGGTVTVDGPTSNGDGSIDYGDGQVEAIVSGGTIIAVGSSGMAENFGSESTQYAVEYTFESAVEAGTELTVTDSEGNVVLSYTPAKRYQSAVFSTPELAEGEYTITAGDWSDTFSISDIITSAGNSSGMSAASGGGGGMGGAHGGGGSGSGRSGSDPGESGGSQEHGSGDSAGGSDSGSAGGDSGGGESREQPGSGSDAQSGSMEDPADRGGGGDPAGGGSPGGGGGAGMGG